MTRVLRQCASIYDADYGTALVKLAFLEAACFHAVCKARLSHNNRAVGDCLSLSSASTCAVRSLRRRFPLQAARSFAGR